MTSEQNFRDEINTDDVDRLGPADPNVAGNRTTDESVDHEQLIGEPVDDDPVLDAERTAAENTTDNAAEDTAGAGEPASPDADSSTGAEDAQR